MDYCKAILTSVLWHCFQPTTLLLSVWSFANIPVKTYIPKSHQLLAQHLLYILVVVSNSIVKHQERRLAKLGKQRGCLCQFMLLLTDEQTRVFGRVLCNEDSESKTRAIVVLQRQPPDLVHLIVPVSSVATFSVLVIVTYCQGAESTPNFWLALLIGTMGWFLCGCLVETYSYWRDHIPAKYRWQSSLSPIILPLSSEQDRLLPQEWESQEKGVVGFHSQPPKLVPRFLWSMVTSTQERAFAVHSAGVNKDGRVSLLLQAYDYPVHAPREA